MTKEGYSKNRHEQKKKDNNNKEQQVVPWASYLKFKQIQDLNVKPL